MTKAAADLRGALRVLGFAVLLGASTGIAGAAEWEQIGFEDEAINTLAIDPQETATIYAGTDKGLFKSADGGASWNAILPTEPPGSKLYSVVIDPTDTKSLFALEYDFNSGGEGGSDNLVLRKSADAGATFETVEMDLKQGYFHGASSLAFEPKSATLYLIGPMLWASTDTGAHWQRIGDHGSPPLTLLIDPNDANTLYLGTENNDVRKSTDGGKTWMTLAALMENPFTVSALARHPTDPAVLYAATEYGMRKTIDAGMHWEEINEGIDLGAYNHAASAVAVDPANPDIVYAGAAGYLYRSVDAGQSWTNAGAGLGDIGWVKQLVFDPKNPSVLYAGTAKGLWKIEEKAAK
jgi:photosystem II stability/assembly factor-like uncharacterized protein